MMEEEGGGGVQHVHDGVQHVRDVKGAVCSKIPSRSSYLILSMQ